MAQSERYQEQPFFDRIVNVSWASGGVVVLETEFLQGVTALNVNVLDPVDIFTGSHSGLTEVLVADYRDNPDWYAERVGAFEITLTDVVLQDPIYGIWIWDAFLINALGDTTGVAAANALYGTFDLHYVGQQVAYDTAVFGRPVLGDYVTHTHPNGTTAVYLQGATPLSTGYIQWQQPGTGTIFTGIAIRPSDPHGYGALQDFSTTESWYWYHLVDRPASMTNKVRQAWLVYFATDRTIQAELRLAGAMPVTLPDGEVAYTIRGFPTGTEFDLSEGHITPRPSTLAPSWQRTGTFPVGDTGVVVFRATGIVS